jgi:RNA recognition motif-containing protein
MNIFVAKLDFNTTSDDLRAAFERFGEVSSAKVIMDHATGKSKGFAFVEMPDDNEANMAIQALNEREFQGRTIFVKEATPKEDRPDNRNSSGGGGFNRSSSGGGGGNRSFNKGGYGGGGYGGGGSRYGGGGGRSGGQRDDRYSSNRGGNDRYDKKDRYGDRNDRYDKNDRYNDRYDKGDRYNKYDDSDNY